MGPGGGRATALGGAGSGSLEKVGGFGPWDRISQIPLAIFPIAVHTQYRLGQDRGPVLFHEAQVLALAWLPIDLSSKSRLLILAQWPGGITFFCLVLSTKRWEVSGHYYWQSFDLPP